MATLHSTEVMFAYRVIKKQGAFKICSRFSEK